MSFADINLQVAMGIIGCCRGTCLGLESYNGLNHLQIIDWMTGDLYVRPLIVIS